MLLDWIEGHGVLVGLLVLLVTAMLTWIAWGLRIAWREGGNAATTARLLDAIEERMNRHSEDCNKRALVQDQFNARSLETFNWLRMTLAVMISHCPEHVGKAVGSGSETQRTHFQSSEIDMGDTPNEG